MTTLQASIDAVVSGAGLTIQMQTFSGGEVSAETARTRDPGARFDRGIPVPPTIGNVTVSVDWDEHAHGPMMPTLRNAVGTAAAFSVGHIRRDGAGNRAGVTTYDALLIRCTPPSGNTNGGADKATLELEFSPNGVSG